MLEELLMHLNNWFIVPNCVYDGTYSVEDGGIVLPFLVDGQYFRIIGSLFNDGLHKYPATDLTTETFDGAVWALAIPSQVITLADEIKEWQDKQGAPSPYTSESFVGYSYSKATNASGVPLEWKDVFKSRLSRWKKIREVSYVNPTHFNKAYSRPWNPDYPFGGDF